MTKTDSVDVIVIGGGIAGIGCAAMLSEQASVVVVEGETNCGYHSTGRSAAIFIPSYGGPEIRRLTADSESYLATPPEETGAGTFLQPRRQMMIACDGEEELMETLLAESPSLVEISVAEAQRLVPILNPEPIRQVSIEDSARDIDADLLLQCWMKLFRRRGGRIVTGQPVRKLKCTAGVWEIKTLNERYRAAIIVNAAGAWADEIAQLAGLDRIGLTPCRRSAVLLPAPGGHDVDVWPLFASVKENWYARPMSGKLMVSPAEEDPVEPHDVFANDMTLAEGLDRYERAVTVPVARVEHTWAGLRTFAPDRVPVVGFDSVADGFFWLAGQGGYGIQTAPAMSRLASALITRQSLPPTTQDLADALSPLRF